MNYAVKLSGSIVKSAKSINSVLTSPTKKIEEGAKTSVAVVDGGIKTNSTFVKWGKVVGDIEQQTDLIEKLDEYVEETQLENAINQALEIAKESGDFTGPQGIQGPQGLQGEVGPQGPKGDTGATGPKGSDGRTPIKGTDYWTTADKQEIVNETKDAIDLSSYAKQSEVDELSEEIDNYLPKNQGSANVGKILVVGTDGNLTLIDMPSGTSGDVVGTLDENNNILLQGNLADGTYTLKYENEDGTYTEIGSLVVGGLPEPEIPNILEVYASTMKLNQRYSSSSKAYKAQGGVVCIEVPYADIVNKSIRIIGFPYGMQYGGSGNTQWYAVNDSYTEIGNYGSTGIWNYSGLVDEGDGVYSVPIVEKTGATKLILQLALNNSSAPITTNDLADKSLQIIG